ncbi:response regulator transcription factor [Prauserella alba]|uniref:LuxR C-terminal-related transcriptional regulator n=1 Tax=Prauserella alba TaxID=176898 RepID=A0ABN1V2M1_9PSEU|nr:LuxR C-terminal-related transcriptional regulator [Prauserella alba]MCP2180432.1 regulatory protein, luxR family [Prauserella alba]
MGLVDDLHRAREAYERREWVAAYRALADLDDTHLRADDFAALAVTAFLLGRRNDCYQAFQRAYQAELDGGDTLGAVRAAYWLALTLWLGGEATIGSGWLARGDRLLGGVEGDVVERGYLLHLATLGHVAEGEFAEAAATAPGVTEYGRRFSDPDLTATGLHCEGRMTIFSGRVADGLRLLDEAMVSVLAGEVSPILSGMIYCSSVEACQQISDFGRMSEWTHALANWCDSQPGLVAFTGQCAVHRGQLMRLHGAYRDAIDELEHAAGRYAAAGGSPAVGQAHYECGEALRISGEHHAAEAAYAEAAGHGHPAQPGRALLWLARGRPDAASAAIHRVLAEVRDPVHRSQILPAGVDVLAAVGELDDAASLADELRGFGSAFGCTALRAAGEYATASVAVAAGDGEKALAAARNAADGWSRLSAPYEVARCRVLIGRALRLLGDADSAVADLDEARRAFASLGAAPAEHDVAELLGDARAPGGLSPREIEVLRLVAVGNSNPEIAAALVLSEKTVARHLSNIFAKLDVGSRTAAAAFAFRHHLV